jgi:thiamine-monophosphate kinase
VGTVLGSVKNGQILTRRGCNEGDFIVAIGEVGAFWAAVFSRLNKLEVPAGYKKKLDAALDKPIARLKEGQILSKEGLATSCMDNSDSIVSCCYEFAYQNNLDFVLTIEEENLDPHYRNIFKKSGVNPLTAACSWGDWNLICTIPPNNFKKLQKKLKSLGCPVLKIGKVQKSSNKLRGGSAYYLFNDELKPLNKAICSERFLKQSYFTRGIDKYLDILRNQHLWVNR